MIRCVMDQYPNFIVCVSTCAPRANNEIKARQLSIFRGQQLNLAELFDDGPNEDDECDSGPVDSPADPPKVQPFVRSDFEMPALAMHEGYALSAELIWERIERGDRLYAPAEHVLSIDFPDRARESHGVGGLLISHAEILHWLHAGHVREEFRKLPYEAQYRILAGEMVEARNRRDEEWRAFCATHPPLPTEPLSAGEQLSILAALEAISEEAKFRFMPFTTSASAN